MHASLLTDADSLPRSGIVVSCLLLRCFSVVVEYLRNRRLRADAPLPVVPVVQRRNMELLAEAGSPSQRGRLAG